MQYGDALGAPKGLCIELGGRLFEVQTASTAHGIRRTHTYTDDCWTPNRLLRTRLVAEPQETLQETRKSACDWSKSARDLHKPLPVRN